MRKYFLILLMPFSFLTCKRSKNIIKTSTAQENVIILDKKFEILGLNRTRQIRIYLPTNYNESNQEYPVLYMHDGQDLFDDATAHSGEWGVDEVLNELSISSNLNLIVVGIDNSDNRMNEYSPWENKKYGKAEGDLYMKFIVHQIKPFIDSTYRTLTDRKNTAIMGSSMGGLISHYAVFKYPEIFGKAILFSPSYWYSKELFDFTKKNPVPEDTRLYLLAGEKEPPNAVPNCKKIFNLILKSGHPKDSINLVVNPNGKHNVSSWKKYLKPAFKWVFLN